MIRASAALKDKVQLVQSAWCKVIFPTVFLNVLSKKETATVFWAPDCCQA